MTHSDPLMTGNHLWNDKTKESIHAGLNELLNNYPQLDSFVADCLDHTHSTSDLMALYLHCVHVTRMMQLLTVAQKLHPLAQNLNALPKTIQKKKAVKKKAVKKK